MKNRARWFKFLAAIVTLNSASCGVSDPNTTTESSDDIGTVTEAVTQCPLQSWWAQNGGAIAMQPISTHICWLTKAGGKFSGKMSSAGASVLQHPDGKWWLSTNDSEEFSEGFCAPLSCFSGDGVNDVKWISGGNTSAIAIASLYSCDNEQTAAWQADAATILQSFPVGSGPSGSCDGGGEYTAVTQALTSFGKSYAVAHDCAWEGTTGYGLHSIVNSLFVGTPSSGGVASFSWTGWVQSNYTVPLAFADESICYFTKIGGKFRGGGEYARIYIATDPGTGRNRWYLTAANGSAGDPDGVQAEARCYNYHQGNL